MTDAHNFGLSAFGSPGQEIRTTPAGLARSPICAWSRRLALVAALLVVLVAPARASAQQKPTSKAIDELLREADAIARVVSRLRNLPLLKPIRKKIASKNEIRAYIRGRIEKQFSDAELRVQGEVLHHFELIPPKVDYKSYMLEFVTAQLGGYYDPELGRLVIADWIPISTQKPVFAHEIVHALQDQHFGLKRFLKRTVGNADATAARMALVEGEGLAVMFLYVSDRLGAKGAISLARLPALLSMQIGMMKLMMKQVFPKATDYVIDWQLFPYIEGLRFVAALHERFGWAGLDKVYKRLPVTTEQVLHPEKYLKNELGKLVRARLPRSWRRKAKILQREVVGEYGLAMLLKSRVDAEVARRAAAGWNGDQMLTLRFGRKGPIAVLLETHWDSLADAKEFLEAYRDFVKRRYPTTTPKTKGGLTRFELPGGRAVEIEIERQRVRIAENVPARLSLRR